MYTLLTFNICIYLINDCCLNSAFYFTKQGQWQNLPFPLKDQYGSNKKQNNKFTSFIMERLDSKIEMVAFGKINKLDIRGGQLAARENLIFLLNNLPESSLVRDFIEKKIDIELELLASCSDGKLTIQDSANIQNWLDVTAFNLPKSKAGTYRFLQTTNGDMYIGSTGSFYDRIASHRKKFNSKSKKNLGPLHRSQVAQQKTLLFVAHTHLLLSYTLWSIYTYTLDKIQYIQSLFGAWSLIYKIISDSIWSG